MTALSTLEPHWVWLIVAALLATAEIVAPGFFLIWIGGAALVTGLLTLAFDLPDAAQFLVFAVFAFALVMVGRRYFQRSTIVSTDPLLNNRAGQLVGQIVTAVEPVDTAGGRVRVGDSVWSARGGPAQPGERLRVVACERNVLVVERF